MKLHLPCALRAALLALFVTVPAVKAADVTVNANYTATDSVMVGGNLDIYAEKGNITATYEQDLTVTGDVTGRGEKGSITILGQKIEFDYKPTLEVLGNAKVDGSYTTIGTTEVGGNLTVGGAVETSGSATVGGNLTVDGEVKLSGLLSSTTVTGEANLGSLSVTAGTVTMKDALVAGATSVAGGSLTVDKTAALDSLTITGANATMNDNLNVDGTVTVIGADLPIIGVVGSLAANGEDVSMGDLLVMGGTVNVAQAETVQIDRNATIVAGTVNAAKSEVKTDGSLTLGLGATINSADTTVGGDALVAVGSQLNATGDVSIDGSLTSLGTSEAATDAIKGLLESDLIPEGLISDELLDRVIGFVSGDKETKISAEGDLKVGGSTTLAMDTKVEVGGNATLGAEDGSSATLVALGSSVDVAGDTTVNGSLTVTGMPEVSGLLDAAGALIGSDVLDGIVDSLGSAEDNASSLKTGESLTVNGDTTVAFGSSVEAADATLNGNVILGIDSSLTTTGAVDADGNVLSEGDTTINGSLLVTGAPLIDGELVDLAVDVAEKLIGDDALDGLSDLIGTDIIGDALGLVSATEPSGSSVTSAGKLTVTGTTNVLMNSTIAAASGEFGGTVNVIGMPSISTDGLDADQIMALTDEIAAGDYAAIEDLVDALGAVNVDVDMAAGAASMTVAGDVVINKGDMNVALSSTVQAGSLELKDGNLNALVDADVTVTNGLTVGGDIVGALQSEIVAGANVAVGGNVFINTDSTLIAGNDLKVEGGLASNTMGEVIVGNDMTVEGDMEVILGSVDVEGDAVVGGDLNSVGIGATIIGGDLTVGGDTTVTGIFQAGTVTGTVNAQIDKANELIDKLNDLVGEDYAILGDDPIPNITDESLEIASLQVNGSTTKLEGNLDVTGLTLILGDQTIEVAKDMSSDAILNGGGTLDVEGDLDTSVAVLQGGETTAASMSNANAQVIMTGGKLDIAGDSNLDYLHVVAGDAEFGSLSNSNADVDMAGGTLNVTGDAAIESLDMLGGEATLGSMSNTNATVDMNKSTLTVEGDSALASLDMTRSNASMASLSNEAATVDMANSTLAVAGDAALASLNMTGSDASMASLSNEAATVDMANSTLTVEGDSALASLDMTRSNASMASLSNEATAVDMANSTLAVAGDATIGSIALSDGSSADIGHLKGSFDAATDATSAITLDQITGDAASNIQGVITLDSADPAVANSYAGTYNGGVALAMTAGTNATLEQGAGLALTAAANTVTTINNASGGAVTSINSQGTVNLGTMGASMNVAEVSRINAGELNFTIAQDALDKGINAGTGFVVTKGAAFNLTGNTTVNIAADPNSYKDQIIDVAKLQSDTNVLVTFSEGATVDADVVLNFESTVYEKYFKDVKVVGNTIVGTLNRNTYGSLLGKGNGADGLAIIGDALIELNPQKNFKDTGAQKDLASIMDSMDNYKATSDSASANRTAAAIAGASVTAINSAALAGMTNQVSNLYNRAQSRALGMVDGKPGFQAWIQAESFFSDLEHEGNYFSGHKYDAWGASVGADGAISKNMVVGAAFTSMFGDLDSNVADYGNGDMNTYYLSLYARYGVGSWSHSFVGSLGLSSIGFDRTVSFDGNSYKSSGDTNGIGYGLGYELAYRFDLNESKTKAISPIFNASLINNHISGYTETGTDAALRIGSQDNTYLSLGFGAQYEQFVGQKVFNRDVMLGARAMLVTNVGNQSSTADVSFASNPGTISRIDGASPSPAAFQLGAGVSIPVSAKGSSVYCNVNYEVSTKYSDFNANLGYRYSF